MARATKTHDGDQERTSAAVTRPRWRTPSSSSPFSLMRRMAEDMDRMLGTAGLGRWSPALFDRDLEQAWLPQIETFRRGDQLVIRADLPGMKKDDVNVEIENDVLKISGERREEHEEERDEYYRTERSYGSFYRAIPLPEGVTDEQCNATFRDGVLEVTVPSPKETKGRGKRIDIR
ncbi:MAG TPA: Hsp20/alpha crystallin family protein [Longimicrobiales bacterium]